MDALISVICPTRLAVLDERFATATARWPTFTAELMSRYLFRTRWLLRGEDPRADVDALLERALPVNDGVASA